MKNLNPVLERSYSLQYALVKTFAVIVFVFLTALGAYIRIPLWFTPVPVTLQTFFVLLGACILGRYLGFLSQTIYIILGVLGISLFTNNGSGIYYLLGPTAGYLLGFLIVSVFIGIVLPKQKSFKSVFFVFSAASLLILACGALWLKIIFRISFFHSLILGALPFVAGDTVKSLIASVFYMKFKSRIDRFNRG